MQLFVSAVKIKFRVQHRKRSRQPLHRDRQQNLHRQKATRCNKAKSGVPVKIPRCFQMPGVQECRGSCLSWLQGAWRSCGCSRGRRGCQHPSAEPSPFQLLAQLVTFAVMLPFIFFSSSNISWLDRLGDELALECSATQPLPALQLRGQPVLLPIQP